MYIERKGKAFEYYNHYSNKKKARERGKALRNRNRINSYRVIKKKEINRLTGKRFTCYVLYVH